MTQIPPHVQTGLRPHRGVLILIFGILGLIFCALFGIAAWVMGSADLREMQAGRMDPSGYGLTQAGWVLGIIATILLGLAVAGGFLFLLFAIVTAFTVGP